MSLINLVDTMALHNGVWGRGKGSDHLCSQKEGCYPVETVTIGEEWMSQAWSVKWCYCCAKLRTTSALYAKAWIKPIFSDCKERKFRCLKSYIFFSWVFCGIANTKIILTSFPLHQLFRFLSSATVWIVTEDEVKNDEKEEVISY